MGYLFGYTKMPHCFGQRARTRDLFSKPFRKHGITPLSKLLVCYYKGEYVDVIADGAIQKGMPHKFYHGKTGQVFDVTKHAVGVIVNKRVGGRIVPKRIHVRIEHVKSHSPVRPSDNASSPTMPPSVPPRPREPRSTARESPSSLVKLTSSTSPRLPLNS